MLLLEKSPAQSLQAHHRSFQDLEVAFQGGGHQLPIQSSLLCVSLPEFMHCPQHLSLKGHGLLVHLSLEGHGFLVLPAALLHHTFRHTVDATPLLGAHHGQLCGWGEFCQVGPLGKCWKGKG